MASPIPAKLLYLPIFIFLILNSINPLAARDTITPNTPLVDDGQTLVNSAEVFELGFFTPNGSTKRYVGIWYKNKNLTAGDQTVVWIANGASPVTGRSGVLSLKADGTLAITDASGELIWPTDTKTATWVDDPHVRLLDSGNLVVTDGIHDAAANKTPLWQSFDYPSYVLLPGMRLGWDRNRGLDRRITSWKSDSDPSPGEYSYGIQPYSSPPVKYLYKGSTIMCRTLWTNGYFLGGHRVNVSFGDVMIAAVETPNEVYNSFTLVNSSVAVQLELSVSGVLRWRVRVDGGWRQEHNELPTDECDLYAHCGSFGLCTAGVGCGCLPGFARASQSQLNCQRSVELNCATRREGRFEMVSGLKLPETANITEVRSMTYDQCSLWCSANCSCVAFAITEGKDAKEDQCITWFGDLIDIRTIYEGGDALHVWLAGDLKTEDSNKKKLRIVIGVTLSLGGVGMLLFLLLLLWNMKRKKGIVNDCHFDEIRGKELELHFFDLSTLRTATNDFSIANKLGQGGFGLVYQGRLVDGQEIAVKRLSQGSFQGLVEFKNEVVLIAKLQHRNLVRLLGCCIEGEERMLIYEYMHNKSLDSFIFDKTKSTSFGWEKRLEIILGIARGLLYLHQDSRFKIIHRDLKAGNILLDREMNPKISDFGTARLVKGGQGQESTESTKRVIGTFGYMSPEYVADGIFSVKSDVFSFGVMVLEILSGRKNRASIEDNPNMNLLAHAWGLWKEGRCWELLDKTVECSTPIPMPEITRCIEVGLLCVQHERDDRPTMSTVVNILGGEAATTPHPKNPGFIKTTNNGDCSSNKRSTNEITITMLNGR